MINLKIMENREKENAELLAASVPTYKVIDDSGKISNRKEYEEIYKKDGTIKNSINIYSQVITQAGFYFKGNEDSVRYLNAFFDNLGSVGTSIDKEDFLDTLVRYPFIYGSFYAELVSDKKDKQIVDIEVLDPKKMDYARNEQGQILVDAFNRPIGYIEKIEANSSYYFVEQMTQKYKPPKEMYVGDVYYYKYIPRERIAHYNIYTVGDRLTGIGMIETIYNEAKYKQELSNNYGNNALKHSAPKLIAKVGDETHEPTPTILANALEGILNVNDKSAFSFPYWVDVSYLQADTNTNGINNLNYYNNQVVTGTELPGAIATGVGEATNRSTLVTQTVFTMFKIKYFMRKIGKFIERQIAKPVLKTANLDTNISVDWGNIDLEELDSKMKRLTGYAKNRLITPTKELEEYILNMENIDLNKNKKYFIK